MVIFRAKRAIFFGIVMVMVMILIKMRYGYGYFSREARDFFWAFWGFKGDFLTKFGKVLKIIRPTHHFFTSRYMYSKNKSPLQNFRDLDLKALPRCHVIKKKRLGNFGSCQNKS